MDLKSLKKKYELDDLELYSLDTVSHKTSFTANKLKQADLTQRNGLAIRLIKDKKLGFASQYGKADIESLVKKALYSSKYSNEVVFKFPNKVTVQEISEDKENNILKEFQNVGYKIVDRISKSASDLLIDLVFDKSVFNESIQNSNDLDFNHQSRAFSFSISLRETNENDFFEIFSADVDDRFPDYEADVENLIRFYKHSRKHAKVKNGSLPILFTSKAVKDLFDVVESALNGKIVNERSSPWSDKLGQSVLSKDISIIQDPSFGHMKRTLDDEGVEIKKLPLINKGVLENFYYDLSSASKSPSKASSTGNGFRGSISSQPDPSLLNMIISPGKKSLDEIIKDIKYGVLIDQSMGTLSGNISGDISANIDIGFLIENGEIVGRVKDTMFSGNIYTALNNVLEISSSPRFYWSNMHTPDILLGGFNISSE